MLKGSSRKKLTMWHRRALGAPRDIRDLPLRYERNSMANLFMMFAPLEGWRHVDITDRHAAVDYAQALEELSDVHYPSAEKRKRAAHSAPASLIHIEKLSPALSRHEHPSAFRIRQNIECFAGIVRPAAPSCFSPLWPRASHRSVETIR
jgi:hypothetical protein